MAIFSRMSDIVQANINAMLDKAEDPEKMVRLIIKEMEDTLVEVRTSAARTIADKKEVERKRAHESDEADVWAGKAEVAIRKEREDLARAALLEKRRCEDRVVHLDQEMKLVDDLVRKLQDDIETLTKKLLDAKGRQQSIFVRGKTAKARLGVKRVLSRSNVDDAMIKFEQHERKIDDLEGEIEAYSVANRDLHAEIDELELEEKVDADLEALRQRLKQEDQ